MAKRPVILVFLRCYLPGHKSGGPVRSVSNLVERLGDEFEFRIVTSDRDSGDTKPYEGIVPGEWTAVGKAMVCYLAPEQRRARRVRALLPETPYDVLYLQSLFNRFFTLAPLVARRIQGARSRPVLLAPRGELSPGALAIKPVRKRLFLRLARASGFYRGIAWHATSEQEEGHIREWFGDVTVFRAANIGCAAPETHPTHARKKVNTLKLVFLSRIVPKKNLLGALRVLQGVRSNITLTILGTQEDDAYWQECEVVRAELPGNVTVEYAGSIAHEDVLSELARHDLFFFPTRGENYGHVIVEALCAGLPILISDQTPWRNLEDRGVGWDIALDNQDGFLQAIERCAAMDSQAFAQLSCNAYEYGARIAADPEAVEQHRRMFQATLA